MRNKCSPHFLHPDYVFGRCLPPTGYTDADLLRMPLSDRHSRLLIAMLDEMQAAGIGWDSRFAQCRIRAVLTGLQDPHRAQRDWRDIADPCAHLVSEVNANDDDENSVADQRGVNPFTERMAYVRFVSPVSDVYGSELAGTPPPRSPVWQKRQSPIKQKKQHLAQQHHSEFPPDLVQDIRHRIELRRMLAEYEAGALPEPVYKTYAQQMDRLHSAQQALLREHQLEWQQLEQQRNQQQLPGGGARSLGEMPAKFGIVHRQENDADDEPNIVQAEFVNELAEAEADGRRSHVNPFEGQRTVFRELSRDYSVPKVVLDTAAIGQLAAAERSNELPLEEMVLSVTGDEEDRQQQHHQHQQQRRRQQEQLRRQNAEEEAEEVEPFDVKAFLEQMKQERFKPLEEEVQQPSGAVFEEGKDHLLEVIEPNHVNYGPSYYEKPLLTYAIILRRHVRAPSAQHPGLRHRLHGGRTRLRARSERTAPARR